MLGNVFNAFRFFVTMAAPRAAALDLLSLALPLAAGLIRCAATQRTTGIGSKEGSTCPLGTDTAPRSAWALYSTGILAAADPLVVCSFSYISPSFAFRFSFFVFLGRLRGFAVHPFVLQSNRFVISRGWRYPAGK